MTTDNQQPDPTLDELTQQAAAAAAASVPETLEAKLADTERRLAEMSDAYLRAKAEVENTRRRGEEDTAKASKFAVEGFADAMLPVVPKNVRRLVGTLGTRMLKQAGPLLDSVLHRVPVTDLTTFLLRHTGVIKLSSDPEAVTQAVSRFLQHDWRWYFTLALALGETRRQDLSPIVCPVTLLAGRDDVLATTESMSGPVGKLPQARLRVLPCSHYLPLEAPDTVSAELDLVLDRVRAVDFATSEAFTSGSRSRT